MEKDAPIFVAGHLDLVGGAIRRRLEKEGCRNLVLRAPDELSLTDQAAVHAVFAAERPRYVFLTEPRMRGKDSIASDSASFMRDSLLAQINVLEAARLNGCRKVVNIRTSSVYSMFAPQPFKEEQFVTEPLYLAGQEGSLPGIAGVLLGQAYRGQFGMEVVSAITPSLYGPGDDFGPGNHHLLPALVRRFHDAKRQDLPAVTLLGDGSSLREFLHADDLADAALFLVDNYHREDVVNVGTGEDLSIRGLSEMVRDVVGYQGKIAWDYSEIEGLPRRLLDVSRLTALGWKAKIPLHEGVAATYGWFMETGAS